MAFSQKHSGKVFVPWFNTSEWRYVYDLVTSNADEEKKNALNILKIWKVRTPLLSAGVEGTLILLEALLSDVTNISEPQIIQIYSLSLMRFLNICAGNNERQGTFNRTASKNDLPKWIIDIRHDIAHSNKLPSRPMLEMALNYSFQWLIEKYWQVQNLTICDYCVDPEDYINNKIVDTLNAYIKLTINLYWGEDMDAQHEALMEKVNYFASKRYNTTKTDSSGLLLILEEILKQALCDPENKGVAGKVAKILADENALFAPELETNDEGIKFIPKTFKDLWSNLMNILFENGFLTTLLNELLAVATTTINYSVQEISSLWITDILNGLLKNQSLSKGLQALCENKCDEVDVGTHRIILKSTLERDNPEFKECIEFVDENKFHLTDLRTFEDNIMQKPNVHSITFLEKVLVLNNTSEEYKKTAIKMAKLMCDGPASFNAKNSSAIFTIKDLSSDMDISELTTPALNGDISSVKKEDVVMNEGPEKNGKWQIIQDTSPYKNCPLGVLPHQNRNENPLLIKDR